jgi:hypothetical protein
MPRCSAFEAMTGRVGNYKNRDIVVRTKVCRNAHCQSMSVRIWSADSAVAMTLYTYLCGRDLSPIDSDDDGGEVVSSLDMTNKNDKPSVAVLLNQIGGGIESVMGMIKVATALLRGKGVTIDEDCDAMFQKLPSVIVSSDPSNVVK